MPEAMRIMRTCAAGGGAADSCICMLGQPLRFHHW